MEDRKYDRVTALVANLPHPRVVADIDRALTDNQHERLELLELRKWAVRRHGEPPVVMAPPETSQEASGQVGEPPAFDGTVGSLAHQYRNNEHSGYHSLHYKSREHYDSMLRRIERELGPEKIETVNAERLLRAHQEWAADGRIAMGHSLIGMMRMLATFGSTILKDRACRELRLTLHDLKFPRMKRRAERLTAEQVIAIRAKAHEMGRPSIALAQAFQYESKLRQKDVIGEWVPISEPGESDIVCDDKKWVRGILWSHIDDKLVLRRTVSSHHQENDIEINLKLAPMIMDELDRLGEHPTSGPIVTRESDGMPWSDGEFRRIWRRIATAAGVPKSVRNMDSRAGGDRNA